MVPGLTDGHRRKGARLGVATDERVEWLLALTLHRLGGGGVYVETPLGWRAVAMAPDTPGSRINQAAAGREFGLDPGPSWWPASWTRHTRARAAS
jgi:hypothetical protein